MAASLRTPESVLELAGCDRITIPPGIIQKLAKDFVIFLIFIKVLQNFAIGL